MTPNDLYQMTPEKEVTGDISLWREDHIEELRFLDYDQEQRLYKDDFFDITTKFIKDHCFDGERTWTLGTIWFKDSPVMIFQNAGRGGRDHDKRFITDEKLYRAMVAYIMEKLGGKEIHNDVVDPTRDIPELTNFYNQDLTEPFERW